MKNIILLLGALIMTTSLSSCADSSVPKEKGLYAIMKTSMGTMIFKLYEDKTPITVENFAGLASGTKEWLDPKSGQKVKKPFYNGLIFHRVIKDFMIQGGCPLGNGTGGPGYAFQDECYEYGDELTGNVEDEQTALLVWTQLIVPYMQEMNRSGKQPNKTIVDLVQSVQKANSGAPLIGKSIKQLQSDTGRKQAIKQIKGIVKNVDYGTICMANSGPDSNGSQFFIVTKKDGTPWLNGKHTVFGETVKGMDVALKIQDVKTLPGDRPEKDVVIESVTIQRVE